MPSTRAATGSSTRAQSRHQPPCLLGAKQNRATRGKRWAAVKQQQPQQQLQAAEKEIAKDAGEFEEAQKEEHQEMVAHLQADVQQDGLILKVQDNQKSDERAVDPQDREARGVQRCVGGAAEFEAKYEVLDELGRGEFGVVSRARERTSGKLVAVKRLPCGTEEAASKSQQEVEIFAKSNHENIAGLLEHFKTEGELLLVQELCSGGTLDSRLVVCGGRLPEDDAASVTRQVVEALRHCHRQGLAHNDLKGDNVLFFEAGSEMVKLIDFGLAAPLGAGSDEAFDVWSVGALLFRILAAQPLYDCSIAAALEEQGVYADARQLPQCRDYVEFRLSMVRGRMSSEAFDLLGRMLSSDGARRSTTEDALSHPFLQAAGARKRS